MFFQVILVLVILAAMILILLGIGRLGHENDFEDATETELLKEEVEDENNVISSNSIFKNLVEKEANPKDHKESSNGPSRLKL